MATLICNATGNLTGASTFAAAEAGALAIVLNRNTIESLANNANVTSATFTVTNAKVIDAVLLWVRQGAAGSTGTFKVDLQKGGVSQASVTVNRTDLPVFVTGQTIGMMVPVLFKLSSTATGDGGANWTIVLTNSNGTNAVAYAAATASTTNFTRALRTTTAATPAAADDLYVVGELTGAGTHTSRTVTMDSTATTAYGNGSVNSTTVAGGGIHVSCYGTLAYGTTASTNYVLRVNGDLIAYEFGALSIGSSGSEIPRTSTAVLEFQQVSASGDFGLRCLDNTTVNIAGLSRTSGKNVTKCKLTADLTGSCVLTSGPTTTNGTNTALGSLDPSGMSLLASSFADNGTNSNHSISYTGPSITNTTQIAQVYLAAGSGTNKRFVRVVLGNATTWASVTNGFWAEVDLQSGTVSAATNVGNGASGTAPAITVCGGGYIVTLTGKVSTSAATPSVILMAESATNTISFAGASNQCFIYEGVQLVTAASISTTLTVDTDTGWLSGDAIIVASTTRTAADCEDYVLNANAGASSMTTALYPFGYGGPTTSITGTHNGTSPIQAEIGLLTRNVKIRSTSSSLMSYVYFTAFCTATVAWAEFYYLGVNTINKRGVEVDALVTGTAGAKSITFCSVHDSSFAGLYGNIQGFNSLNLTFSNNVLWNTSSTMINFASALTLTDWTLDNNLMMKGGSVGILLADLGGTCTNNTTVGMTSFGFSFQEVTSSGSIIGTFDSNTAHSGANHGWLCQATFPVGTVSHLSSWRNSSTGIFLGSTCTASLTFSDVTVFGNASIFGNFDLSSGDTINIIGTSNILSGDTTFSSPVGIAGVSARTKLNLQNVDMSGTTSIYAAHTSTDFSLGTSNSVCVEGTVTNCKFGAPTVLQAKTSWSIDSYLSFEKYGQTAGDHRTEMTYGQLKTDSVIFNTVAPSMRMTPNNASNKLESAPKSLGWKVPVSSGNTAAIAAYIYKSKVGDGAAYNGNQPRLIQRANAALGQPSDVVLGTYGAGTGSWNQLSANTSTATDDGAWEIIVDCDGTAGWINVDDLQVA